MLFSPMLPQYKSRLLPVCFYMSSVLNSLAGVDWGGLRREWIELLSQALFEPGADRLFTKFKDDNQALV